LRERNPAAHTSISLDLIAAAANPFLGRAARVAGQEVLEWDTFDVFGVCVNLIDQVSPPEGELGVDVLGVHQGTGVDGQEADFDLA